MISHKDYISGYNIALEEASQSTAKRRVGSVVLDKNGKVIAKGHNSDTKKHSIMVKYPPTNAKKIVYDKYIDNTMWNPRKVFLHAECDAIRKITRQDLSECVIIVVRKTKAGKVTMSKPCGNCMSVINHYKLKEVIYSDWEGEMVRETLHD